VIIAVVALVGAIIYAYTHFQWFRDAVSAVWDAIKFGAAAVGSFFVGVWNVIGAGLTWLGGVFTWLWTAIISPVFSFIGLAARILVAIVLTVLITPIVLYFQLWAFILTWLWTSVVSPIFGAIGALAVWLYQNALLPVFTGIQIALGFLGSVFVWLWQNAVVPAFNGIMFVANWLYTNAILPVALLIQAALRLLGSVFVWLWENVAVPTANGIAFVFNWLYANVILPVAGFIQAALRGLGAVFTWLWLNIVVPVFNGIATAANWAWTNVILPVFNALRVGVDAVGKAFQATADWIGRAWASIREAARAPVQWVIDVVYNNGIRKIWNGIASVFALPQLGEVRMAGGGVLPGYAPGRDVVPALLSPGEAVLTPEAVRAVGAGNILALNAQASGRRPGATPGYADGGIVGDLLGGTADFFTNVFSKGPAEAVKALFASATGAAGKTPGGGGWHDALVQIPVKMVDAVVAKAKALLTSWTSMGGGPNGPGGAAPKPQVMAWIAQALGILGWPMSYSAGIYQQAMSESGGNPTVTQHGYVDINTIKGDLAKGIMQTISSTFNSNALPGHHNIFNPVDNIIAASRYAMNKYGAGWFAPGPRHNSGYDNGGYLPTGWSTVYNGTSRPEPVLTDGQWQSMSAAAQGGDGPEEYVITSGQLEIIDDGLVRVVDGRLQKVGTRISNGRRV
jgi:hypothetical protein